MMMNSISLSLSLSLWKWMRHGRMPLVCKLMHEFLKPWYLRKRWLYIYIYKYIKEKKKDEEWLNDPSSTINVNFEKSYCVRTFNKANIGVKQDQNDKIGQNKDCWNDGWSKLKIDSDCWLNERFMSTSCKRFFPWAC